MTFLDQFLKDRSESIEQIEKEKAANERKQADIDWGKVRENMKPEDYESINTIINNFIKQMPR